MKYQRILKAMGAMPWMIEPEKLEAFMELLMLRVEGGSLSPDEIAARTEHPRKDANHDIMMVECDIQAQNGGNSGSQPSNIAVIPVYGVIMHRPSMDISSGGCCNIQDLRGQFQSALENPSVSAIVLDVDSPGGTVDGVEELSQEIYKARRQKPITAVANTLAASAAYYLASSAQELAVTPSGEVGSIGVYMLHQDMTGAFEKAGVKNTLIKAGKYKAEGNPWMELDDHAMASLQDQVNGHYEMFTAAVGRNRGVSADKIQNGFGEGRTVMAKKAVRMGMADKVATLAQVLDGLGAKNSKKSKISGEAETLDIQAEDVDEGLYEALRQRELDLI